MGETKRARLVKVMGKLCFSNSNIVEEDGLIHSYTYFLDSEFKIVKHGDYSIHSKDNVLLEKGRYRNGKRTGSRRIYKCCKNTNEIFLYSTIEYRGGKRSGPSYGYYESGAMRYIMNYSGGKIIGTAVSFSSDGKLIMSLSTTVTNKTTDVLERTGVHKVISKSVHGITDYEAFIFTLRKYFDDVHYEK